MYKLKLENGLLHANATICHEGESVTIPDVIIDTGSSNTFILTDFLDKLNIGFDDSDELVVMFGIGGVESPAVRKKIGCLSIGDIYLNNLPIDFGIHLQRKAAMPLAFRICIYTQGEDIAEAMYMARDAIGMWICYEQDEGRSIPSPNQIANIKTEPGEIKTLVDIDIDEYRRSHDNRTVRKNLTIPGWLNERAEKAGVNFSQILQEGLKKHLGVEQP